MATTLTHPDHTYPTLLEFLAGKYEAAMLARNAELAAEHTGKPGQPPEIDVRDEMAGLQTFFNFANELLTRHRPVELFYPDANFGIKLDNGEVFVVAPALENVRGYMQPSAYVPITGGAYAKELANSGEGAYPISGHKPAKLPAGLQDMTQSTGVSDRTQSTGPKSYDR